MGQITENDWEMYEELTFTASGLMASLLILGVVSVADFVRRRWLLFAAGIVLWMAIFAGLWRGGRWFGLG